MDKLEEIKNKISEFQAKSAAKDEIKAFVALVIAFVKKAKDNFESLSDENLAQLKEAISYIETQKTEILSDVKGETARANKDFASSLREVKNLLAEVRAIKATPGLDGKDADEEKIVEEVLARIPTPKEYEVFTLDEKGKEIVGEINALPTDDDDLKIDASHIKNLPPSGGTNFMGAVRSDVWHTGDGNAHHRLSVQATAPENPAVNDLWLDIS